MTSIYIHYPYCETLCPYCDFFSSTRPEAAGFFDSVTKDLQRWHRWLDEGEIRTIYVGGGTPSRMPDDGIESIVETVRGLWGFPGDALETVEFTLEANPGDIDPTRVAAWRKLGVNRLSVGAQSFRDEELALLGRRHDSEQALRAATLIGDAGFSSYSLDLIFGLPGQSMTDLDQSLDVLAQHQPPHLSLYGLTIEEGTAFGSALVKGDFEELERGHWLAMYRRVCRWARDHGYEQYEVSNFAKPGHASRHNRAYWRDRSWVGVGPGAHGQRVVAGKLQRRASPRSVQGWMQAVEVTEPGNFFSGAALQEELGPNQWLRERAMVGIRDLVLGIDPASWGRELGLAKDPLDGALQEAISRGWIEGPAPFRLTRSGLLVSDQVAELFLVG